MSSPKEPKLPFQEGVTKIATKTREPKKMKQEKIKVTTPVYRLLERVPSTYLSVISVRMLAKSHQRQLANYYFPEYMTLDMHGMHLIEAEQNLGEFVSRMFHRRERYVLIITGQGRRSAPGALTLKQAMTEWVNHPTLRGYITSLVQAFPMHGGEGAYYLILAI